MLHKFIEISCSINDDYVLELAFEEQFKRKGRATIGVPIEVLDQNDVITMTGTYEWFVQKL